MSMEKPACDIPDSQRWQLMTIDSELSCSCSRTLLRLIFSFIRIILHLFSLLWIYIMNSISSSIFTSSFFVQQFITWCTYTVRFSLHHCLWFDWHLQAPQFPAHWNRGKCWGGPSRLYRRSSGENLNWRHHYTSTTTVVWSSVFYSRRSITLHLSRQSTCWPLRFTV